MPPKAKDVKYEKERETHRSSNNNNNLLELLIELYV